MSEIDRFNGTGHKRPDGALVLYSDHVREIEKLKAENAYLQTQIANLETQESDLTVIQDLAEACAKKNDKITKLKKQNEVMKKALEYCLQDAEYFEHATKRYLESGQPKQDIEKVSTPVRAIKLKINEALQECEVLNESSGRGAIKFL